jgi:hypothetical protein
VFAHGKARVTVTPHGGDPWLLHCCSAPGCLRSKWLRSGPPCVCLCYHALGSSKNVTLSSTMPARP